MNTPSNINTNPFSRTFGGLEKVFKYNQVWAIIIMLLTGFGTFGQFVSNGGYSDQPGGYTAPSADVNGAGMSGAEVAAILGVIGLVAALVLLVSAYINGITAYVTWKTMRQETAGIIEAFSAVTKRFWTILGVQALTLIKVLGGLLLFIIPGFRAALRYQMALLPVFEDNLTARGSMKRMKGLARGHLMEVFGVTTVASIVPVLGSVLQIGGHAVMYPELVALSESKGDKPKVHWLNYLAFIILGLIAAAVIVVSIVVALI